MRVLHINAYDGNGGAGRAVLRLHGALKEKGVHSDVLCMYRFQPRSDTVPVYRNWLGKIRSIANIFLERYLTKALVSDRTVPFSLQRFGLPVHRHRLVRRADVLHLHWINHGMLAPGQLKKLFRLGKPIGWTLHDSNPLTGGCHVRYDCRHYEQSCGKCPVLGGGNSDDLSHRTWKRKRQAYEGARLTWVAPSRWMGDSAERAALGLGQSVRVIGNALNTNVFRPLPREACRDELGIPREAFVLLSGYMPSSTDRHKGGRELRQALRHFREQSGVDHDNILLVFFGGAGEDAASWPYRCHFAGKVQGEEKLAGYYSAANMFLFPSLQESMGYTALESLSCGTPVVAFRTSGVTDVVLHERNGYLAAPGDTRDFAAGMDWVYRHPQPGLLAGAGREHALKQYTSGLIAERHLALYEEVLKAVKKV